MATYNYTAVEFSQSNIYDTILVYLNSCESLWLTAWLILLCRDNKRLSDDEPCLSLCSQLQIQLRNAITPPTPISIPPPGSQTTSPFSWASSHWMTSSSLARLRCVNLKNSDLFPVVCSSFVLYSPSCHFKIRNLFVFQPFLVNLENLQLFGQISVPGDVLEYYVTLLFEMNPSFSAY